MSQRCDRRLQACCTTVLSILGLATARAWSEPTSTEAKFTRLDEVALATHDLTANYQEEKFSVMLLKPLVSKGHVFVKGERTRWHTTSPYDSTLFTNKSEIAIYFPARKVMEVYAVDRQLRSLIVSPVPHMSTIREQFTVEVTDKNKSDNTLTLRLIPIGPSLADYIEEVRVVIDMALGLATRVEMIDRSGDRTVVTFTAIRTNLGLQDNDVSRNVPAGTKTIRPMERKKQTQRPERSDRP